MTIQLDRALPNWLDVSRETFELLQRYVGLVEKWTPVINLVSRKSVPEIWQRHVLDSAQLFSLVPKRAKHLVDLGSGGGFPGVVLGILARDAAPELRVSLVEADQRKATFLSEALRQLNLSGRVVSQRIETLEPQDADVVTARALAPLVDLCGYAHRHLDPGGAAIFSKGLMANAEIDAARLVWSFSMTEVASKSAQAATILTLTDLKHV